MSARALVVTAAAGLATALSVWAPPPREPLTGDSSRSIEPSRPIEPPALALGSPTSPHRLVVYSDYECDVCAMLEREAGDALRELARTGRLRLELRHAPLPAHRRAPRAAAAAVCAERQGRGWAMHRALLGSAARWRSGAPAAPWFLHLADSLGLERGGFVACLADPAVAAALAAEGTLAASLGIAAVPAIHLDGRALPLRTSGSLVRGVRRAIR